MSNLFELNAELRSKTGTSDARRLRHQGQIPAVVYGSGQEPQTIVMAHKDIFHALENEAVFSHVLKLTINGKQEDVVLKAVQRHPYKPKITHVDFLRVNTKEKISLNVPLHFINEETSLGVKAGGNLSKTMTELEITCLPSNLPEFINVDIAKLELGHALHISDIQLPKGVELGTELNEDNNHAVISVHKPKGAAVKDDDAAEDEEKAEG